MAEEKHTYIDDIVDAIFNNQNHRKIVLKEAERRILEETSKIFEKIFTVKSNASSDEWWKNELILNNSNKKEVIWFGGLNAKTVFNILGTTKIDKCKQLCSENYEVIATLIKELPFDFPKPRIELVWKGRKIVLSDVESIMLIHVLMVMAKTITGGIWSEIGKQAGEKFLKRLFKMLGITENMPSSPTGIWYKLNVREEGREKDAVIYYNNKRVLGIEIKILGAGNPEIVDEAISRLKEGDVFLVDSITELMKRKAEEKGIKVILLSTALRDLYELLKEKGIPTKINFQKKI